MNLKVRLHFFNLQSIELMDGLVSNNFTHCISQGTNSKPMAAGPPPAVNYSTHPIDGLANSRPTAAVNYSTHPIDSLANSRPIQGTSLSFVPAIPTN